MSHLLATVAAADAYDLTAGRLTAIVAGLLGLTSIVTGGLALPRPSRISTAKANLALAVGLVAMALGGLVVATADGGLGTGNGLGGGVVALVLGLIGTTLNGLARTRSRRTT